MIQAASNLGKIKHYMLNESAPVDEMGNKRKGSDSEGSTPIFHRMKL